MDARGEHQIEREHPSLWSCDTLSSERPQFCAGFGAVIIPTSGSSRIYGMHFNVRLGVTDACYIDCRRYCAPFITLSPDANNKPMPSFDAVVGQKIQLAAKAYFSDCTLHDFTGYATWSSSNPAVASVAAGLVTHVAGGSSAISATDSLKPPGAHLVGCGGCPGPASYCAQATANDKILGWVAVVPVGLTSDRPCVAHRTHLPSIYVAQRYSIRCSTTHRPELRLPLYSCR